MKVFRVISIIILFTIFYKTSDATINISGQVSGKWTKSKTLWVTALCGIGHVLSSVVLGFVGIALGIAVSNLELVEGVRGDIAAWLLIAFGFVYFAWGLKRAYSNKPHSHAHVHEDGTIHAHEHMHKHEHSHVHESSKKSLTPWILFTIFIQSM
jgi:ABC-type nickel/cobalt efflux system permease component RcnA